MLSNTIPYSDKLVVINNFIEKDDVDKALHTIKKIYSENKGLFPFVAEGRVGAMCLEDDFIKQFVKKYGLKAIDEFKMNAEFPEDLYFSDYITVIYTEGGSLDKHSDDSEQYGKQVITSMIYLNDDYEGGEIVFEELGMSIKPKAGSSIIFPGQYFHEVKKVVSGQRYAIGIGTTKEKEKWLQI